MTTRIGFSTNKTNWISRIIRWFTKGEASHCFLIYYDDEFERDMVMEATEGGFKITPFSKYQTEVVAVFMPKQSIEIGVKKAVDWLEESYDYTGLFGMIWVCFGKWLKRKWNNPLHSANTMFCSEAVVKVLQLSNYPRADQFDASSTSPEDLLEFFQKENQLIK